MLRIEKDTDEVRGGETGTGLRYVLGISTALAILALVALAYGLGGAG